MAKKKGEIYTGPSERPPSGKHGGPTEDTHAYDTRPGNKYKGREYERYSKIGTPDEFKDSKDVDLPLKTASPEVHKRMAELRAMRKK